MAGILNVPAGWKKQWRNCQVVKGWKDGIMELNEDSDDERSRRVTLVYFFLMGCLGFMEKEFFFVS